MAQPAQPFSSTLIKMPNRADARTPASSDLNSGLIKDPVPARLTTGVSQVLPLVFGSAVGASVSAGVKVSAVVPFDCEVFLVEISAEAKTGTATVDLYNSTQLLVVAAATTVPNGGVTQVTNFTSYKLKQGDVLQARATTASSSSITGGVVRAWVRVQGAAANA